MSFETAKYKFRTRFKIRIGRTIFFNSKCRKVSRTFRWFFLFFFKNTIGNPNCPVSKLGQFHWNSLILVSFSETVCPSFLEKKCELSKVSQKLAGKKGTFLAKTQVKAQFHEKTAFNFLFYCATVSVENWQIKMALFVPFFGKLLKLWTRRCRQFQFFVGRI